MIRVALGLYYRSPVPCPPAAIARRGLSRVYYVSEWKRHPAPRGWRYRRVPGRDARELLPLWLALSLDAWDARWAPVRLAMRLGLWRVSEGDYYVNGHASAPRWLANAVTCFLTDTDRAPT